MKRSDSKAGNALATAVLMILALSAILSALFTMTTAEYVKSRRWRDETRSFYVAEAGANEAYATLVAEGTGGLAALVYPRTIGQGAYTVDVTLGEDDPDLLDNRVRLVSRGQEGRAQAGIEVIAWAVPNGKFLYAAFGDQGVHLNSNSVIDSYDSNDGPYVGPPPVGAMGSIGSNEDISFDANVAVYGDVTPGPGGVVIDSAPNTLIFGATGAAEDPVVLEPVTVPGAPPGGALVVDGPQTFGPGSVHWSGVTVHSDGALRIVGPATVVVDDLSVLSNGELVIDAAGGPVEIYSTGDFDLRSNSYLTATSAQAKDVSIYLTGDTDASPAPTIALNSNAEFTGTIYAPNADLVLESNFHLYGAVMAEEVELASNAELHFDEDLLYQDGVLPDYEQLAWRILPAQEE
jgi:hypothetical protein